MRTPTDNIRIIGETNSIAELNTAYNETVMQASQLSFDGITTRDDVERTLNHLTNYNIVRIANHAYEQYAETGERGFLIVIGQCRDSLKEHEDIETERELLDNLCDQLEIR